MGRRGACTANRGGAVAGPARLVMRRLGPGRCGFATRRSKGEHRQSGRQWDDLYISYADKDTEDDCKQGGGDVYPAIGSRDMSRPKNPTQRLLTAARLHTTPMFLEELQLIVDYGRSKRLDINWFMEEDVTRVAQHGRENNCVVCYENRPSLLLLPCQHFVLCAVCYERFLKHAATTVRVQNVRSAAV